MQSRLRLRARQAVGKIRRFFRASIYTAKNDELLSLRSGECTRCGACCKILFRCPFLIEAGTEFRCRIYGRHFTACKLFPLEAADVAELDGECTFYFVKPENVMWAESSPGKPL